MEFDMDQAAAARVEARGGEEHSFVFHGVSFALPPEMPLEVAESMAEGNHRQFMQELLDGQADKFFELQPTVADMRAFVEWISGVYLPGTMPGESSAPSSTSKRTSTKSRRPSSSTTESS